MADMSGEKIPKQYQFKNSEYIPYIKKHEGTIEYQTKKGSYDPNTQEFITYLDSVGVPTIGYGTTSKSSSKFNVKEGQRIPLYVADMALDQEIDEKLKAVNRRIPVFNNLPENLRVPMLSSFYRGGLSGSPETIKKINKGDFKGAAKEFLNNKEYKKSKKEGTGVAKRMEELSNALLTYSKEAKRKTGGMVMRNYYDYEPRSI